MRFDTVSQMRTVESLEEDARREVEFLRRWYGSQARLFTHFVCPFRGWPRGEPVFGSQSRTVLSIEPVAMMVSSWDQQATRTQLVWPLRVWRGVPVSVSKIRAVLSPLPVTSLEEVEDANEVVRMASPWPGIEAEHLDTARTRKTACGVYWRLIVSSVVVKPGCRTAR